MAGPRIPVTTLGDVAPPGGGGATGWAAGGASAGMGIEAMPIAPARFAEAQRSSAVFACDFTLSDTLIGGNAFTYTAILPRTFTPARSSHPASGIDRP